MRYTTRIIVPPKVRRSGLPGGKDARHAPQVIGVKKSFGFGDRLGLAGPGQVRAASAHRDWAPFFAQQSPEELARTGREPLEVVRAAVKAMDDESFRHAWGADADGLKTPMDVEAAAAAGFTYFTIDPSAWVRDEADRASAGELGRQIEAMILDGDLPENWSDAYLGRSIDLPGDWRLELTAEPLQRAAVKFGRAIQHCLRMYEAVARASHGRPFEIEVAMDRTARPATPLEHLFVGLELEARQVRLTSLALRFAGEFEIGVDFGGSVAEFEARLREHVAIAQFCGPYKLSMRGGADKFSVYPVIGRLCGEQLHVKTAGTSYLEGLRAVLRADLPLFMEIVQYAAGCFAQDREGHAISTTPQEVAALAQAAPEDVEDAFLAARPGRQMLLVTYGSVLAAGRTGDGRAFKEAIAETLTRHADLHHEIIAAHFARHLRLLDAG